MRCCVHRRHSGTRRLARARNPYAVTVVVLRDGQRLSLKQRWPVVMDSGLAAMRRPGMTSRVVLAACFARAFANSFAPLRTEGAGNAGCTLHPRSRVPRIAHLAHTSIQVSGNTPTSPAQWLYGLLRALPGERACCHRHLAETSRKAWRQHRGARTTRLGRTPRRFVRRANARLTPKRPSHPRPNAS